MSNGLTPLATPRLSVEKSWKIRATKTVVGVIHVWKYHKCFQGRIAWFVLFRILIDMGHLNLTGANRLCIYIYTCIYIYICINIQYSSKETGPKKRDFAPSEII